MFGRRSFGVVLTVLITVLSLGGCSGSSTPTTSDPVAWVDKVCGALLPLAEVNKTAPKVDATDFAATKQAIATALTAALDSLPGVRSGLDAAGPSPVPGGDEVVTKLREVVDQLGTTMTEVKTKLEAANTNDATGFVTALADSLGGLAAIGAKVDEAQRVVNANGELKAAAQQSRNCEQVGIGTDFTGTSVPPLPLPSSVPSTTR